LQAITSQACPICELPITQSVGYRMVVFKLDSLCVANGLQIAKRLNTIRDLAGLMNVGLNGKG